MFWLQNIGDLNEIWDVNDALHSNLQACTLHIQTCTMISKAQYLAFSWNKVFPIPTRGLFSCEILFYDTCTVGKFSMRGALWPTEMWRHCKIFCQKVTWRTLVIFACTGIPNILWRWLANYYVGWVGLAIIVIGICEGTRLHHSSHSHRIGILSQPNSPQVCSGMPRNPPWTIMAHLMCAHAMFCSLA